MQIHVKVECYSGSKSEEYPVRFRIDEVLFEILEIEDRWYSPGFSYFKVFCDDAKHYILKKSDNTGLWSVKNL